MTVELDYGVPTCYWLFRCKEKYLVTNAGNFSLMIVKLESLLLHKKGRNAPWNAQVSFKVIPEHTRSFLELTPINLLVHFCIFANHKRFYYVKLCVALVHHYLSLIMSIFLLKKTKALFQYSCFRSLTYMHAICTHLLFIQQCSTLTGISLILLSLTTMLHLTVFHRCFVNLSEMILEPYWLFFSRLQTICASISSSAKSPTSLYSCS